MRTSVPLTLMPPSREARAGLAATENSTLPAPCPLAGLSPLIHWASVEAVQAHSAVAPTVSTPVPPAPATVACSAVNVIGHLLIDSPGPVTELDVQPAKTTRT